ncbi:MAG TPA: 3-isopropylmalate dehydrogenase [Planctomycetes bacterium]|nr:3-isopropylmalate dehydrogenase [Planctomycetota bacterium]
MPGKNYRIAVIGGDGTGPEVVREAVKVADAAAAKFGFKLDKTNVDWGGERYLKTGQVLPPDALDVLRGFDAILLGAIGHPDVPPGVLEKGILLALRFGLDQYINLRPVKLYPGVDCPLKNKVPADIDFVVVRENTEGLYSGMGGSQYKGTPDEVATQIMCNTRHGVERCIRYAFELTRKRHGEKPWKGLQQADIDKGFRGQLHLVAKTNVLTFAHDLWWRAFNEVGAEYPEVKREYAHVDATCMWFVKNPEWFDVIVTCNMFGDIITDLGAMIQGGMGIAAGANVNPEGVSMFEPIGGSAPKYTGKNVINPLAAVCAGGMMLGQLGEHAAASAVEKAVMWTTLNKVRNLSAGKMGFGTAEVGDIVARAVADGRSPEA